MNVDLSTTYLGMPLTNPLVASPSPLTGKLDTLRRLEDSGIAAVVLPSLFEEQIEQEDMEAALMRDYGADASGEAHSYFPDLGDYNTGPDRYLELIREARKALSVPVIASLNGTSPGGWVRYANLIEQAGASALELNVYAIPADMGVTSTDVEDQLVELVSQVRQAVQIPLAVKLGPFYSALGALSLRLKAAGADGLVLFNRFMQPDIDLSTLAVRPEINLSTPDELRLSLRWIAILSGQVELDFAGTSGVHSHEDALKLLLVGANVAMMTSALLRRGHDHTQRVLTGMDQWLEEQGYASVEQLRGSLSQRHCPDPTAFERSNYMKALTTFAEYGYERMA